MNRRLIAAAWISGATVPLLLAAAFLIGCCVLPFHGIMHKLMPLCDMAAKVTRGDQVLQGHEHDAMPPAPAREKQEPGKRIATNMPSALRFEAVTGESHILEASANTSYRSFITLGAVRCDQDVGLHVLVETYLI